MNIEELFFSPVVQRSLISAVPHLGVQVSGITRAATFLEALLTSFLTSLKNGELHGDLGDRNRRANVGFADVERYLESIFSLDAIGEAEQEGASALSVYVSAGPQARHERCKLQSDLSEFTIIGEDVQEEEFLSEEAAELPITAALIQQRLVAAGLTSNSSPDKSAAVYMAGVLEHALTKLLLSAARIAAARRDSELQEGHLVQALHTDMQSILLPFLSHALQQATPSSSMTSAVLLQAEDPPSNDTAQSFLLEPIDGLLHQRSSMSTFLVEEYEPTGASLAPPETKTARSSAELSLTPTSHSLNEPPSLPVASIVVQSSSPTLFSSSPSLSLRHSAPAPPAESHAHVIINSTSTNSLPPPSKNRDRRRVYAIGVVVFLIAVSLFISRYIRVSLY